MVQIRTAQRIMSVCTELLRDHVGGEVVSLQTERPYVAAAPLDCDLPPLGRPTCGVKCWVNDHEQAESPTPGPAHLPWCMKPIAPKVIVTANIIKRPPGARSARVSCRA
jgi:hypothetical protein